MFLSDLNLVLSKAAVDIAQPRASVCTMQICSCSSGWLGKEVRTSQLVIVHGELLLERGITIVWLVGCCDTVQIVTERFNRHSGKSDFHVNMRYMVIVVQQQMNRLVSWKKKKGK